MAANSVVEAKPRAAAKPNYVQISVITGQILPIIGNEKIASPYTSR